MRSKITRNDVAQRAGVSPAVVSYVLNNSNYVSAEKRAAVLKAASELDYSPNLFAQGLRTDRSYSVALVGDSLHSNLFPPVAAYLLENGLYSSLFYAQRNDKFVQRIIDGRFDAIFMTSNGLTVRQLNRIVENGTPMVLYQSRPYPGLAEQVVTIAPDFYGSMCRQVQYLIDKGHRRIGYVPPLFYKLDGVESSDFRMAAYRETLARNGIEIQSRYLCLHTDSNETLEQDVSRMCSLEGALRPTALICSDDGQAAWVMQLLRGLGLAVPDQIAVMGWGNDFSSQITTPQISTVDINMKRFVGCVGNALVNIANGRKARSCIFTGELILRESV